MDDSTKVAARKGLGILRKLWEARSESNLFYLSMLVDETSGETVGELSLRFVQHGQSRRQLRRKKG